MAKQSSLQGCFGISIFIVVVVLAIGALGIRVMGGAFDNYSAGVRSGTILKLSEKNWIAAKSHEGTLLLNQFAITNRDGSTTDTNAWDFSASDPEVVKQLNEAAASGERVTLHYKQWLLPPWRQHTDYTVTEVTKATK